MAKDKLLRSRELTGKARLLQAGLLVGRLLLLSFSCLILLIGIAWAFGAF